VRRSVRVAISAGSPSDAEYETTVQYLLLDFTFFKVLEGTTHGEMNLNLPTAMKGTTNHDKTSFSIEIFAGAIISVVQ
jgi:hypothetical protein